MKKKEKKKKKRRRKKEKAQAHGVFSTKYRKSTKCRSTCCSVLTSGNLQNAGPHVVPCRQAEIYKMQVHILFRADKWKCYKMQVHILFRADKWKSTNADQSTVLITEPDMQKEKCFKESVTIANAAHKLVKSNWAKMLHNVDPQTVVEVNDRKCFWSSLLQNVTLLDLCLRHWASCRGYCVHCQ